MRVFRLALIIVGAIAAVSLGIGLYFVFAPTEENVTPKPTTTVTPATTEITTTEFTTTSETTTLVPNETTPEPNETTPEPIETTPEPNETTPEPIETTPEPIETTPEPTETTTVTTEITTEITTTVTDSTTIPTTLPVCDDTPTCDIGFVGKLPYPSDCTKYIECDFLGTSTNSCPEGLEFSPTEKECMSPETANCPICVEEALR